MRNVDYYTNMGTKYDRKENRSSATHTAFFIFSLFKVVLWEAHKGQAVAQGTREKIYIDLST